MVVDANTVSLMGAHIAISVETDAQTAIVDM
jgi:hypothetical protein